MSDDCGNSVLELVEAFPPGAVVRAFRDTEGKMGWELGCITGLYTISESDDETPDGFYVKFLSDGTMGEFPFSVVVLAELDTHDISFLKLVPKDVIVRERFPVGSVMMSHVSGRWHAASVKSHTTRGIVIMDYTGNRTVVQYDAFESDGKHPDLRKMVCVRQRNRKMYK